jgi:WD40 repeat protein/serine/threonine protein kinase
MAERPNREQNLFLAALEQEGAAARADFLDRECGDDAGLRRRIEALLNAHGQPDSLLDKPAVAIDSGPETVVAARPNTGEGLPAGLGPPGEPGSLGRLDHYEVLNVVGKGGMGVVLRARDTKLQRIVALKVLAPRLAANATARQRIVREAQAAAAVCHDHVVGIHAVRKDGRLPYLVMEFIGGITLEERIRHEGALPVKEVLRIGMQIAHGLAAAHAQGLVHRDIKPGNILLENGVQRVKITDFGLARAGDDFRLTQAGMIAGTPEYMSPEQARGEALDPRADLFSLGSVLHTMCTGSPPFRARNPVVAVRQVCNEHPRPIRVLNPDIPPAVCAVVERLHSKLPSERYQTAAEVADVLAQLLAELQQPRPQTLATPPVEPARPVRWRRSIAAAAVLVVLAVVAVLMRPWLLATHDSLDVPPLNPVYAQPDLPPAPVVLDSRRREDIPSEVLKLIGADPAHVPTELVAVLGSPRPQHPAIVDDMRFVDADNLVTADWQGNLAWWDPARGTLRRRLPAIHAKWIRGLAISHDGNRIATGGTDGATSTAGRVQLWDAQTGAHLQTIPFPLHVLSIAFSPNGKWLAVGSGNDALMDSRLGKLLSATGARVPFVGQVILFDATTGRQVRRFTGSTHYWIQQLAFSPDSRLLAVAGHDRRVRLFDPETGTEVRSWDAHDGPIDRLAFHPGGTILATAGVDWTVRLWNVATGGPLHKFEEQRSEINAVCFSPDGRYLAAADAEGAVTVWDAATYARLFVRTGHAWHTALAFHPKDNTLAAVDAGNRVRRWQLPDGKERRPAPGHVGAVHTVAVSRDGRLIASGGADGTVHVWDVAAWQSGAAQPPARILEGHNADVVSLAFSHDGTLLASGSRDRTIGLWDSRTGRAVGKLAGRLPERPAIAFSRDSKVLAAGGDDGIVLRWQVATGAALESWRGHSARAIGYSADGRLFASAGSDGTVRLRDTATGRVVHTLLTGAPCADVTFSADGAAVAAVTDGAQSCLYVWDVASGRGNPFPGHATDLRAVAFHPEGRYLVTGGPDGMMRIWDQRAGNLRVRPLGPGPFGTQVACVACLPDGRHVVSANANGTLTILRIAADAAATYPGFSPSGPASRQ